MRHSPILTFTLVLFFLHYSNAQEFIVTSELGGGRVYSLETTGANPTILMDFSHGSRPLGNLVLADDKYWGLTYEGGRHNYGAIFSIDKDGSNYEEHHFFDYTNGANPVGELVQIDGKLWGVTESGGNLGWGIVFTIDFQGNFSKVIDMQDVGARIPEGRLADFNGKVWGVTTIGATNNDGCVFYLNYNGTGVTKHYEFVETDGANPKGGLVVANNELWGVTLLGGANDAGTIFTIDQFETVTTNRHEFSTTDGYLPSNYLAESGGEMWGIAKHGGTNDEGVIFSIATSDYSFTKHHDFTKGQGVGNLLNVGDDLWGFTDEGGAARWGTIFKIANDGTGFEELHEFNYTNGADPKGGLIQDGDLLIGMTEYGGFNIGTIFGFDLTSSDYSIMHEFGNPNGSAPIGRPIESCGKLLGGAGGGENGYGVIYQTNFDGSGFSLFHEFTKDDGDTPAGFTIHEGQVWGFAVNGGENDAGTIFSVNMDGTSFTIQHHFETNDGHSPAGSPLIIDGIIYGTTKVGGSTNKGVVFSFDPESGIYTKLHEFSDGASSAGNLLYSNDRLWGTTISGGTNFNGILYSIKPDGSDFVNHNDFENGVSGIRPRGTLAESNGRIWGTSQTYVYSIATDGTDFKVEHTLTNDLGSSTESGIISYNNQLWIGGGMNQDLVSASLLSMNSDGTSLTKLAEYDRSYGGPTSLLIVEDKMNQTLSADQIIKTFGDSDFALTATSSSSNTIFYKSENEDVISIDGSTATITGAGETSIYIYQEADVSYYSGCLSIDVTIAKANQDITFMSIEDKVFGDPTFELEASSTSGLGITFESSDESVATVSGSTVTITGTGDVMITASQEGNNNYLPAADATQSFSVASPPEPPLSTSDKGPKLIIYPNPNRGSFEIQAEGLMKVTLMDLSGKILDTREGDRSTYEFANLKSGVYLLKGETKSGSFEQRIVIE